MDEPLMLPTPGITTPRLTKEPLGTEGEMTPGPDDMNPYEDPDAAREIQRIQAQRKEIRRERQQAREGGLIDTIGIAPLAPQEDPEPFAYDDFGEGVSEAELPGFGRF